MAILAHSHTRTHPSLNMSPPTLNPVMLKELRQLVRARFISSVVLVFLVAELSIIGLYVTNPFLAGPLTPYVGGRTQGLAAAAGPLFRSLLMVLSLVCGVAIPGYVGIRLGRERSEANLDLLFATTLKPGAIIRGKLYSGLILVALMFSLAMPFMTFIYLFRGLDLSTVFLGLGCVFLASVVLMQFGLLVGSLPTTRMFKAIVPLALLGVLGWSCYLFWFHYVFSHYWGSRPSGTAWVFRR
ncbi:MAG: hypothetical protein FJ272_18120, partial [Planctomycetes bacterium]|nr:hypothetical protein [Planctomycetota bacterium]